MLKQALVALVLFYRNYISPLMLRHCRFCPSCSQYAYEALEKKGAARGLLLICKRILRCHPWNAGGYDPVT